MSIRILVFVTRISRGHKCKERLVHDEDRFGKINLRMIQSCKPKIDGKKLIEKYHTELNILCLDDVILEGDLEITIESFIKI